MTEDNDLSAVLRAMSPEAFKAKPDELYHAVVGRLRFVLGGDPGEPWPAWSTGEWLAVALALGDDARVTADGWTVEQATNRVADGWNLVPGQVAAILARALAAAQSEK